MQFASRPVFDVASGHFASPTAYGLLFAFLLVPLVVGLVFYVFTRDTGDGLN